MGWLKCTVTVAMGSFALLIVSDSPHLWRKCLSRSERVLFLYTQDEVLLLLCITKAKSHLVLVCLSNDTSVSNLPKLNYQLQHPPQASRALARLVLWLRMKQYRHITKVERLEVGILLERGYSTLTKK